MELSNTPQVYFKNEYLICRQSVGFSSWNSGDISIVKKFESLEEVAAYPHIDDYIIIPTIKIIK